MTLAVEWDAKINQTNIEIKKIFVSDQVRYKLGLLEKTSCLKVRILEKDALVCLDVYRKHIYYVDC